MKRVLILGASGLVGRAISSELSDYYEVYGTYYSRKIGSPNNVYQLNVKDLSQIRKLLTAIEPDIVISCLRGDYESQLAAHIEIAEFLKTVNGKMYYCSTANVYDNYTTKSHDENEKSTAKSDYGIFKVKCEEAITDILDDHAIILRLPMIFGRDSPRFNLLKKNIAEGTEIEVPADLFLTTNTDKMLARQIRFLIENNLTGVFHLATDDTINYYNFIKKLLAKMKVGNAKIRKTTIAEEDYYLAVFSSREELTDDYRITNEEVIDYLSLNSRLDN